MQTATQTTSIHERRKAYARRRIAAATNWPERREFIGALAALTAREWDNETHRFAA